MAEYIKPEKDRYIKLSQALEVLDRCSCWWAHDWMELIPAANVQPVVQGEWIPVGLDDADEGMFKCSECGSEHFFPEILLGIHADNFCPNCGADMRKELPKEE